MPKILLFKNDKEGRRVSFWFPKGETHEPPFYGWPGVNKSVMKRLASRCLHFLDSGAFPLGKDKFKHVEGQDKLHEIKCFQHRFIGVWETLKEFIILLVVQKKKDKHKPSDLKKAQDLFRRYLEDRDK